VERVSSTGTFPSIKCNFPFNGIFLLLISFESYCDNTLTVGLTRGRQPITRNIDPSIDSVSMTQRFLDAHFVDIITFADFRTRAQSPHDQIRDGDVVGFCMDTSYPKGINFIINGNIIGRAPLPLEWIDADDLYPFVALPSSTKATILRRHI